jgi:hypothetical protein
MDDSLKLIVFVGIAIDPCDLTHNGAPSEIIEYVTFFPYFSIYFPEVILMEVLSQ